MAIVVPSILTDDPQLYRAQMTAFNAFANRIQINITDGEFAQGSTVALNAAWWPKGKEADLHMMVAHPSQYVDEIIKLHPSLVVFHAEVEEDLSSSFQKIQQAGIRTGVALSKSTFPGTIANLINYVDHVLVCAGTLEKPDGDADFLQIEKTPIIRSIKQNIEIGWYGGATFDNIRAIAHSDIDVVNVGQPFVQAADPAETYRQLSDEADKKGVRL